MKIVIGKNRKILPLISVIFCLLLLNNIFGASDYSIPGEMPLMSAVRQNQIEVVKTLISDGADVNTQIAGSIEVTPLMVAARYGHTAIMKILIDNGAYVNTKSDDGYTALMRAARNGQTAAVKILIQNKAEINAYNYGGISALEFAATYHYNNIVEILLENGANCKDLENIPKLKLRYCK